jgi:hypothetical protein
MENPIKKIIHFLSTDNKKRTAKVALPVMFEALLNEQPAGKAFVLVKGAVALVIVGAEIYCAASDGMMLFDPDERIALKPEELFLAGAGFLAAVVDTAKAGVKAIDNISDIIRLVSFAKAKNALKPVSVPASVKADSPKENAAGNNNYLSRLQEMAVNEENRNGNLEGNLPIRLAAFKNVLDTCVSVLNSDVTTSHSSGEKSSTIATKKEKIELCLAAFKKAGGIAYDAAYLGTLWLVPFLMQDRDNDLSYYELLSSIVIVDKIIRYVGPSVVSMPRAAVSTAIDCYKGVVGLFSYHSSTENKGSSDETQWLINNNSSTV